MCSHKPRKKVFAELFTKSDIASPIGVSLLSYRRSLTLPKVTHVFFAPTACKEKRLTLISNLYGDEFLGSSKAPTPTKFVRTNCPTNPNLSFQL